MVARRLLIIALVGESALAAIGLIWIWMRQLPFELGDPWIGLAAGLAMALAFGVVNYNLLWHAPDVPLVRGIRELYRDLFRPLFRDLRPADIALISVAAGAGEEILFRGAVQADFGLIVASLLFGAVHIGGSGTIVFGAWAALMGLGLGWLAIATGGLMAPIVAHAVYDAGALAYVRWGSDLPRLREGEPERSREEADNAAPMRRIDE
jgi:uncharacterized protein